MRKGFIDIDINGKVPMHDFSGNSVRYFIVLKWLSENGWTFDVYCRLCALVAARSDSIANHFDHIQK